MQNLKLKGEYVISLGSDLDSLTEVAKFENLITDAGLAAISTMNVCNACWVGSGNTPPVNTDTGLVSLRGSVALNTTGNFTHHVEPEVHSKQRFTFIFNPGSATGNIAEVGVASGLHNSTTPVLFSRALIKDTNGDPTVITKLSTDYLRIDYYLSVYPDVEDVVQTFDYKGVETEFRSRPCQVNLWEPRYFVNTWGTSSTYARYDINPNAELVGINDVPSTTNTNYVISMSAKVAGAHYRDFSVNIPYNYDTSPSIEVFRAGAQGNGGIYQAKYTPPLSKDPAREQLILRYRVSWGRK